MVRGRGAMGVQDSIIVCGTASEIAAAQTQRKQPRFNLDKEGGLIYRAKEGGISMVYSECLRDPGAFPKSFYRTPPDPRPCGGLFS